MIRNNRKYHFIYKTTNILNGKFYIGMHSTDNLNDGYLGSGKRIWYSIKKYGKEKFKIEHIEFYPTRDALIQREIELINKDILKDPMCMNLMQGGWGGFVSKEHQFKRSQTGGLMHSYLLKNDIKYRKKWLKKRSELSKQMVKDGLMIGLIPGSFKDHKHSKETIEQMKRSAQGKHTGKLNSQYSTCWITNKKENKKIKKQDLHLYKNTEWKLGRTMHS